MYILKAEKDKFARFRNQLLNESFLNDGTYFAQILGRVDFIFWESIHEKPPYLVPVIDLGLDPTTKGQIILERLELETSPKRIADLLQAVYETLAYFSITPRGDNDGMWRRFIRNLFGIIERTGFSTIQPEWITEPEAFFSDPPCRELGWWPGELKINYTGEDWGVKHSQKLLKNGFTSKVLENARLRKKTFQEKEEKKWNFLKDILKSFLKILPLPWHS